MDYKNLAIQECSLASLEYLRMIEPSTSPTEKEKIERNLMEYCSHDTLAMLKNREEMIDLLYRLCVREGIDIFYEKE